MVARPVRADHERTPRVRRLFSAIYDSVRQREIVTSRLDRAARADASLQANLTARLRLDIVLSGQVVVTDAQVLDGLLFASTTPEQVATALEFLPGPAPPLVVRSRAPDLQAAVLGLVTDPDTGRIKPFLFSLIADDNERTKVDRHLLGLRSRGTRAPTELGELEAHLARAGLDEPWLTLMHNHWRAWAAAPISGKSQPRTGLGNAIAIEQYRPELLDLRQAVALADLDDDSPDQLVDGLTPGGAAVILEARDAMSSGAALRTDLYRLADSRHAGDVSARQRLRA